MSHTRIHIGEKQRMTTVCAGVSSQRRAQYELAARLNNTSMTGLIEHMFGQLMATCRLPHATGIPTDMQDDPRVLANLRGFKLENRNHPATIQSEPLLWNSDDPAVLFFRRAYLMQEILTPLERQAWEGVRSATAIDLTYSDGQGNECKGWADCTQERYEQYIAAHWDVIARVCAGELPAYALPIERRGRNISVKQEERDAR